jgi:hypothetical protein
MPRYPAPQAAYLADPVWHRAWITFGKRAYGFDATTAQRLTFLRWLIDSGRLSEW